MYFHDNKARPRLITRSLDPENQESPMHFIPFLLTIPNTLFFRRNHFPYPILTPDAFSLKISGSVNNPFTIPYTDFLKLPAKSQKVLIECSGNKRAFFKEKVFGEQWENGALSEGVWKGVPLKHLLKYTGIGSGVKEVVFRGRDHGIKNNENRNFERSLPINKAVQTDVMIAYEYNGKPLSHKHGFPFRVIVPGWYGMASVKWLTEIILIENNFSGPFQTEDYVYHYKDGTSEPVTENHVNSTIQQPLDKQILKSGTHWIKGIAWTGSGRISKVEISFDNGQTWDSVKYENAPAKHHTVSWTYPKEFETGQEYHITIRATDSEGNIQPAEPVWNRKGYGYNASMQITIKVE
ncbi:sulfite oxidase [Mesobacillus jeotgali]|uniref:sulfite oxidase n=1 Tax=Mesobacillus jeotgali TaxID=129985 RepID=UPI0009A5B0E2|nr:sulfite oxidase [Mesobacillus jeotgali]